MHPGLMIENFLFHTIKKFYMIEKTNYTSYNDLALLISFRARQEFVESLLFWTHSKKVMHWETVTNSKKEIIFHQLQSPRVTKKFAIFHLDFMYTLAEHYTLRENEYFAFQLKYAPSSSWWQTLEQCRFSFIFFTRASFENPTAKVLQITKQIRKFSIAKLLQILWQHHYFFKY